MRRCLFVAAALIVATAGITACGGGKAARTTSSAPVEAPSNQTYPTPTTAAAPAPEHLAIGSTTKVKTLVPMYMSKDGSAEGTITVTLSKAEKSLGDEFNQPERTFLVGVKFEIRADQDGTVLPKFYWRTRTGERIEAGVSLWSPTLPVGDYDLTMLDKGEKKVGWYSFDVPTGNGEIVARSQATNEVAATWDVPLKSLPWRR